MVDNRSEYWRVETIKVIEQFNKLILVITYYIKENSLNADMFNGKILL